MSSKISTKMHEKCMKTMNKMKKKGKSDLQAQEDKNP